MLLFMDTINRVLGHEGNYVNNPKDPGGETKFGISKRTYPHLNIKDLTRAEAIALYRKDFWDKLHGDNLYDGVAYQLLDFAVNSGMETALRYFQRALGVADDGHWGPVSQAAADTAPEYKQIMLLIAERQDYQSRLVTWDDFGKGWARRNSQNLRYAALDT